MFSSSLKTERASTSGMQQDKRETPLSAGRGVLEKILPNYFGNRNNFAKPLSSRSHLVYDNIEGENFLRNEVFL